MMQSNQDSEKLDWRRIVRNVLVVLFVLVGMGIFIMVIEMILLLAGFDHDSAFRYIEIIMYPVWGIAIYAGLAYLWRPLRYGRLMATVLAVSYILQLFLRFLLASFGVEHSRTGEIATQVWGGCLSPVQVSCSGRKGKILAELHGLFFVIDNENFPTQTLSVLRRWESLIHFLGPKDKKA
jgi:hypothetical protein